MSVFFFSRRLRNTTIKRHFYNETKKWEPLTANMKHHIENYWSDKINRKSESTAVPSKNKYYILSMFPYPSGKLHMGHVRVYTISDSLARFYRMQGKEVIHPMGWDAFGLPAENAAISQNLSSEEWTKSNIEYMKKQLIKLGISFDWQRELATCSPEYYRWTQFIFLKLYEKGFLYQKEALVNWDPVDQTVLAEEQVDANGCSWRSGAKVQKIPLKQWFIKTTKLSQSLTEGLQEMTEENWGDIIKLQRHWIGECEGYNFELPLKEVDQSNVTIWTRNPESLKSALFIALKSSHILVKPEYRNPSSTVLNINAVNPLNGRLLPVVIADDLDYPEGSESLLGDPLADKKISELATRLNLQLSADEHDQRTGEEICQKALSEDWGGYKASSKLRDWLVSRQRYWGTPIPIIHCKTCGTQPVPVNQLPVFLPALDGEAKGHSALLSNPEFYNASCPKCGAEAKRETDTMDTFVDSTWYFLRYLDPTNLEAPFDPKRATAAMPVDIYIGGKEHAVLHLYFARFMSHFFHLIGWSPEREPFKRLLVQGMVMGRSYRVKGSGKYLKPEEVDFTGEKPVEKSTKKPLAVTWEKMSKSKFNGVEPECVWDEHGIDTTRLLILADVSPRSSRHWSKDTFPGILNWQDRLWSIMKRWIEHQRQEETAIPSFDRALLEKQENLWYDARNFYLKGATFSIHHSQQISVAISKMQGLTNNLKKVPNNLSLKYSLQYERALGVQIIMLAPLAPHFASEMWTAFVDNAPRLSIDFDWAKTVLEQSWPQVDYDYNLDLVCVVNNQQGCTIKLPRSQLDTLDEAMALRLLQQDHLFIKYNSAQKILSTKFDHYPGMDATLTVITEPKKKQKACP
ncbi:leucine--tRNA ligase, mitochondrial-like [Daphnia carinata]|uniref:leucine--tRNA ligase, mitochondrial-like n=1 Tax=Daphnia carinata TaxID=120202 RepID=UPI00257D5D9C|nr:leucine--tRNA ligase, mitochondrial-like [Daphnia carinata]XP_059353413.1 leucine--tRNA ligase, mitochondrial-like [Daphnia carinata]